MADLETVARDALKQVYDPEAGINIVDLGLIYEIRAHGRRIDVTMTFTSPGCPAGPFLVAEAEGALRRIEGVDDVSVELSFEPPWTPAMITADGQAFLGAGA